MTSQPTTAITPYNKLKDLMRAESIQAQFSEVLGQKARGFLASVLNTVWTNEALKDAEPNSIIVGAMKAAVLDLPIDNNLGFGYLVPYRENGVKIAQFQIGYRGIIQLALRTRRYEVINAVPVFEGEQVIIDRLTGRVKLNGKQTSDAVTGYVSYFKLKDGFEHFCYMTVEEIEAHAKRYSKSYGKASSAWSTHFDAMARKTVLKMNLGKYGPLSVDLQEALKDEDEDDDNALIDAMMERSDTGDVIDTTFQEVQEDSEIVSSEPDFATFLVKEKLAIDIDEAEKMLVLCKLTPIDETSLRAWAKIVNAWIDATGCSIGQATRYANKGETPK